MRRNPADWSSLANANSMLDRGYTMHEHLTEFGIIHMNGRLYDPELSRMLSPDNHVQDPGNSQNYNRYSYVLNNPLKYTDPSGEYYQGAPPTPGTGVGTRERYHRVYRLFDSDGNVIGFSDGIGGYDIYSVDERGGGGIGGSARFGNIDILGQGMHSYWGAKNVNVYDVSAMSYQGNEINWGKVGNGTMGLIGGAAFTVGGVLGIASGVGAAAGVGGISLGIPAMGFGLSEIIDGFEGGNRTIPGGVFEAVDIGMGGDGSIGQIGDIFSGGLPKSTLDGILFGYDFYNSKIGQTLLNQNSDVRFKIPMNPLILQPDNLKVNITLPPKINK